MLRAAGVEDTDFLKVRNIGVSYSFDVSNNFLSRFQLGVNVVNPFAFATSSFDPEVTGAGIAEQGGFAAGGFGFGTTSNPIRYLGTVRIGF